MAYQSDALDSNNALHYIRQVLNASLDAKHFTIKEIGGLTHQYLPHNFHTKSRLILPKISDKIIRKALVMRYKGAFHGFDSRQLHFFGTLFATIFFVIRY